MGTSLEIRDQETGIRTQGIRRQGSGVKESEADAPDA
jgi:hypothetical protein